MSDDVTNDQIDSAPVEASGAPSAEEEKQNMMQEVAALISINGGKLPASVEEFWYQVGLAYQMAAPRGNAAEIARLVFEKLGEPWDDDFVEEDDGNGPSLLAYETLLNRVRDRIAGVEAEDADDDEETSGALANERGPILVAPLDPPIQTIVGFIEDGTLVLDPDWQRGYVWKPRQRKRFIESILLGLPIPPVLLFKDADRKIYVIDGRQRLETVFRFRLGSKDRERRFKTFDRNSPGWREKEKLHACAGKYFDKLPDEWQRQFNAFVIPARIFSGLPRRTLYEVFKRYNTGAVQLQAAEIRKAVYQGAPLHDMLFRVAGEQGLDGLGDAQEKRVARSLWNIMKKRTSRYGAYNFVGRCLAFANVTEDLSVAAAINKFMDDNAATDPEIFRREFLDAFEATLRWYEHPLSVCDPDSNRVTYHEWVATIQVVSTIHMLRHIQCHRATEAQVMETIKGGWQVFVGGTWNEAVRDYSGGVLQDKQNTGTHWNRQRAWITKLEESCGIQGSGAAAPEQV